MVVSHLTSNPQWRCAIVSRYIRIRASCQQHQQNCPMTVLGGDEKRRRAILNEKLESESRGKSTWTLPSWMHSHWHRPSEALWRCSHVRLGRLQRAQCRHPQTSSRRLRPPWEGFLWCRGSRLGLQKTAPSCPSTEKKQKWEQKSESVWWALRTTRFALTSAPCSSSSKTQPRCPPADASIKGVVLSFRKEKTTKQSSWDSRSTCWKANTRSSRVRVENFSAFVLFLSK